MVKKIPDFRNTARLSGHSSGIYTISPSPEDHIIYTASGDNFVAAWNLETQNADQFSINVGSTIYSLLLLKDKKRLAIGQAHGGIHIIDIAAKKELRHLKVHKKGVFDIQETADGSFIYAAGADGTLSVWNNKFELIRHIVLSENKLRQLRLNKDGNLLAVASSDGFIRILETDYLNEIYTIEAHQKGVYALHWEEEQLISGGNDAHLRFWNAANNFEEIRNIPAHNYSIYSIVKSPDGNLFATASRDKTVKIWNPTFDKPLRLDLKNYQGHKNSVNCLHWSEFNNTLVSGSDDRSLILWNAISDLPG